MGGLGVTHAGNWRYWKNGCALVGLEMAGIGRWENGKHLVQESGARETGFNWCSNLGELQTEHSWHGKLGERTKMGTEGTGES